MASEVTLKPNREAPGLALFDLDHTLLDGDSDVLWCDFLIDEGVLDAATFGARNAAMERDYRSGSVGVREFCEFYVGTLAGRTPAAWQPLRERFLHERVLPRVHAGAAALIDEHRERGDLLAMTTATNRYITELTAETLGVPHLLATECALDADGCFDGRIDGTPNMRAGKVERLHAWLARCGRRLADYESWAYSDSMNDLPLLEAATHAVATNADERLTAIARQRGWRVVSLRA